ncbi:hypothetical protein B0H63DRAFT_528767 [Podospora didyma]|uniref:Uncharacterized protein n=1 Tax=Podospora didyma TaxID=330526 RepID=A0AAE0N3T9_9PEZI|nr:hypothetical protein B0H63DRAFT_528767 [Podospora didyma]
MEAVSLASSILTFIDIGFKVVRSAKAIHRSTTDATEENVHITTVIEDLEVISSGLHSNYPLLVDDKDLVDLSKKCHALSQNLLDLLRSLLPKNDRRRETLKAVWAVWRKQPDVESIEKILCQYHEQISLHLLLILWRHRKKILSLDDSGLMGYWQEREIPDAEEHTFQWIVEEPAPPNLDAPRREVSAAFKTFLIADSRIFVFCGKAGSGKSTMMKMLGAHPQVHESLRTRLVNKKLVVIRKSQYLNLGKKLTSWAKSDSVKIVCSARPYTVFREVFRNAGATVEFHELTRSDLFKFASVQFTKHLSDPDKVASQRVCRELVGDIVNRADGVFLWASLVVRSLINGTINGEV